MAEDWIAEIAREITIDSLPEEYQTVAEIIGMENALRLAEHFPSMRIYCPKFDSLVRDRRDARIRDEFTGFNSRDLARKYRMSETWIREIVKRKPLYEQADMFKDL